MPWRRVLDPKEFRQSMANTVIAAGTASIEINSTETIKVIWEKQETREAVKTGPAVKDVKYAGKGTKPGTVNPSVHGKNIFWRPVSLQASENESCLLGKGIVRKKNDVIVNISGFGRIGKNWADMIQFSRRKYTITTGAGGITQFLNFQPGDNRFPVPGAMEFLPKRLLWARQRRVF